jgi:putative redox protein
MQAIATWKGGYETQLEDGRSHTVTVDLPVDEGGRSVGTSALELGVLSLAGCISTIFALIAKRRRLSFEGLRVTLEAERPEGAPTITRVHGTVRVRTVADPSEVETTLRLTMKTCPMGVIFERAQIPMDVRPIVEAPRVSGRLSRGALGETAEPLLRGNDLSGRPPPG